MAGHSTPPEIAVPAERGRRYSHRMNKPFARRDSGGAFTLPPGGTGPITAMCPLPGNHLELYTIDATFKVQTPETIDPNRTNPDALWVNAKIDDVGSACPAVARSFLMASEVLKQHNIAWGFDGDTVLVQMHKLKGLLVANDKIVRRYSESLTREMAATTGDGVRLDSGGRALTHFPVTPDLESEVTTFLTNAKRAIREVCLLVGLFWPLQRPHSRLDHLVNELSSRLGDTSPVVKYLTASLDFAARVVKLRNGQEHHATSTNRLYVDNFRMMPTNQIRQPVWYLEGETPQDIQAHMAVIAGRLIDLVEGAFVGCVVHKLPDRFPRMCFVHVEQPPAEAPVKFKLIIDMSQFGPIPPAPDSPPR